MGRILKSTILAVFIFTSIAASADFSTSEKCQSILAKAQEMATQEIDYDPAYVKIPYPGGDVPIDTGVCTDMVVRSLRTIDLDLQKLIHEDMSANFSKYPKKYGNKSADSNIDHRRVWNQMAYFARQGLELPITDKSENYKACDIVSWELPNKLVHIGIVSANTENGRPLILHHIGNYPSEDDVLFEWKIIGHYSLEGLNL